VTIVTAAYDRADDLGGNMPATMVQRMTPRRLASWRAKRRLKRERTGDSEEKIVQRHTSRGRELAREDRQRGMGAGPGGPI
jgi:hypothetical protein